MNITKNDFIKLNYDLNEYFLFQNISDDVINFSNDSGNIDLSCKICKGVVEKESTLLNIIGSFEVIEICNYKNNETFIVSDLKYYYREY